MKVIHAELKCVVGIEARSRGVAEKLAAIEKERRQKEAAKK